MKKKRLKRAMTLMEIMVVIFLIGIITGVVGYNVKGSLDKGKQFKSQQAKRRLEDILQMEVAQNNLIEQQFNEGKPLKDILEDTGLVTEKDAKALLVNGYGKKFEITIKDGVVSVVDPSAPSSDSPEKVEAPKKISRR